MTLEYKVFHAVGAVVADVQSNTSLSVFTTTDGSADFSDPYRQFNLNSQQTLGLASNWNNAIFDDYGTIVPGSINNPYDPHDPLQLRAGSVYVEHYYYETHLQHFYPDQNWPPGGDLAAYTSIAYSDSNENGSLAEKRYHGYWAQVANLSPFQVTFSTLTGGVTGEVTVEVVSGDTTFLINPPQEAYSNTTFLTGTQAVGTRGVVFVEHDYAAELDFICPKVPIGLDASNGGGSGGDGSDDVPGDPPPNWRPDRGQGHQITQRINISLVDPDPVLEMVLDKIDGEARVAGAFPTADDQASVFGIVNSRSKPGLPVTIDLIAHACDGILQFGTWPITRNDRISTQLQTEWKHRSPSKIRLLGCYTARTTAGQDAMRHLKNVFSEKNHEVRVYGAKTMLFADDFGPEGFHADDKLVEVDALPEAVDPPFPSQLVDDWFARLPPVGGPTTISVLRNSLRTATLEEAMAARIKPWGENRRVVQQSPSDSRIADLFSEFGGSIVSVPGLLEVPDSEQLYPAGLVNGKAVFHRVTSFLGGAFVRVYTTDFPEGVLVRRQASSS